MTRQVGARRNGQVCLFNLSSCAVSLWFHGLEVDRPFITVVTHLMSNHTQVKSHLNRINIVAEAVCGCGEDYETVDHILWSRSLYQAEWMELKSQLSEGDISLCTRDMLASANRVILACLTYLVSIGFLI
jgi:hypothetical protein